MTDKTTVRPVQGEPEVRKGNYLARLAVSEDRRRHRRRDCLLDVHLLYSRDGLRGHVWQPARLVDISEGGARLVLDKADEVPKHFYLYFSRDFGIGCAVVGSSPDVVRTEFLKVQPEALIDYLARERRVGEQDDLSSFIPKMIIHQ